ncbi:hypothetical protein OG884_18285 [Streptosporangium sp. NBC_01755]|uniref:hypothetical protein n=1 Tax=Streptosporangium sp. NBC_01755 TaxID=2975949 RepID=UPI002DDA6919|nr:hypothetical protein [Streptosporangium sp. NBC_01755]WSD03755.1 hypothetical protein OG884_18285 [Streptosporangium sp. NBC_01755]
MTSITHASAVAPSVAVMTAEELAAFAKRLTTLTIEPAERRLVFSLFAEAVEAIASTANTITYGITEETPVCGLLASPDGVLPLEGQAVFEASDAAGLLAQARDGFREAAQAVEELDRLASLAAQGGGRA